MSSFVLNNFRFDDAILDPPMVKSPFALLSTLFTEEV